MCLCLKFLGYPEGMALRALRHLSWRAHCARCDIAVTERAKLCHHLAPYKEQIFADRLLLPHSLTHPHLVFILTNMHSKLFTTFILGALSALGTSA